MDLQFSLPEYFLKYNIGEVRDDVIRMVDEGELRIPNKELMLEFEEAFEDDDFGYVAECD